MTNLIPVQKAEIEEIVTDAIAVTPNHRQRELIQAFSYLAECYVLSRQRSHLADIQALINAASSNNTAALTRMQSTIQDEISQLRRETQQGFMAVADAMGAISDRVEELERDSLRDSFAYRQTQPPSVNVNVTNNSDSNNEETPGWIWKVTVLIAITALLGLAQSMQINQAFWLQQNQQEVR